MRVFIAENDTNLCQYLADICINRGYQVQTFADGANICESCETQAPDLILLDDHLPGQMGVDILANLRNKGNHYPIVVISGNSSRENIIKALRSGADDYIVKPFDPDILLEKIGILMKRSSSQLGDGVAFANTKHLALESRYDFKLDDSVRKAYVSGKDATLTHTEYKIFCSLVHANGGVVTRQCLAESVLGTLNVTLRAIDVHVCTMRRKLGHVGRMVETVRGLGYRFHGG